MFEKLVAMEPVSFIPSGEEELKNYAKEVVLYDDIPKDDEEIIRRIQDADAVLLSYTSRINSHVLQECKRIRYIGMCCSLYSEESANVDIAFAREHGITVTGIRDYGDRGVVEYALYQLIRMLHGFDCPMWSGQPLELTGLKVGMIGMGVSGGMVADALHYMGAEVAYFSRTRKYGYEEKGMAYKDLDTLLTDSQVVFTCLNKNVILLHEEEFKRLGNHKILFNTSIGPSFDLEALKGWLDFPENYFCCDTLGALGDNTNMLKNRANVICMDVSAGRTKQAFELLTQKALQNIKTYLKQ